MNKTVKGNILSQLIFWDTYIKSDSGNGALVNSGVGSVPEGKVFIYIPIPGLSIKMKVYVFIYLFIQVCAVKPIKAKNNLESLLLKI